MVLRKAREGTHKAKYYSKWVLKYIIPVQPIQTAQYQVIDMPINEITQMWTSQTKRNWIGHYINTEITQALQTPQMKQKSEQIQNYQTTSHFNNSMEQSRYAYTYT